MHEIITQEGHSAPSRCHRHNIATHTPPVRGPVLGGWLSLFPNWLSSLFIINPCRAHRDYGLCIV